MNQPTLTMPSNVKSVPMPPVVPQIEQDIREAHYLIQRGRATYGCVCGQVFMDAPSRRQADMFMDYHRDGVLEAIERAQRGESNLQGEEREASSASFCSNRYL